MLFSFHVITFTADVAWRSRRASHDARDAYRLLPYVSLLCVMVERIICFV